MWHFLIKTEGKIRFGVQRKSPGGQSSLPWIFWPCVPLLSQHIRTPLWNPLECFKHAMRNHNGAATGWSFGRKSYKVQVLFPCLFFSLLGSEVAEEDLKGQVSSHSTPFLPHPMEEEAWSRLIYLIVWMDRATSEWGHCAWRWAEVSSLISTAWGTPCHLDFPYSFLFSLVAEVAHCPRDPRSLSTPSPLL